MLALAVQGVMCAPLAGADDEAAVQALFERSADAVEQMHRLELLVQDTNPGGLRFWTRLGFAPVVPPRGGDGQQVLGRDLA